MTVLVLPVPTVYVNTLSATSTPAGTLLAGTTPAVAVAAAAWFCAALAITELETADASAAGHTVVVRSMVSVTVLAPVAAAAPQDVTFWPQLKMVCVEVICTVRVVRSRAEEVVAAVSFRTRRWWKRWAWPWLCAVARAAKKTVARVEKCMLVVFVSLVGDVGGWGGLIRPSCNDGAVNALYFDDIFESCSFESRWVC